VDTDRGTADDCAQSKAVVATREEESLEVEGETATDLYMTLDPLRVRLGHDQAANRQPLFPDAESPIHT
jgi:hypothetical protein